MDLRLCEEEGDLSLGRLRPVRTMHRVRFDALCEIGADRARLGLARVGGTHQLAVAGNRIFTFQHLDHHWT